MIGLDKDNGERPSIDLIDTVAYCVSRLLNDQTKELTDEVVIGLTYEELIGSLLQAKDIAEARNKPVPEADFTKNFNYSVALLKVKDGAKVARAGWNGKGMFIFLVPGSTFKVNRAPLLGIYPEDTEIDYHAHIDIKTADGQIVPWLCSQTDMLADDWEEVLD